MNDPTIGVWISDDGEVAAPDPVNLYRLEGNNPVNSVDPSGLAKIKSIRFHFNGFDSQQRRELIQYTGAAVTKLEKALSMLTDHWDDLEELASIPTLVPVEREKKKFDETYNKLREKPLGFSKARSVGQVYIEPAPHELNVRNVYITTIKDIFSQINGGDSIEFKQENRDSPTEPLAYIKYYFDPSGETIRITNRYWKKRDPGLQIDVLVRELGRREGFTETETGNPVKDASVWQNTIDYLARKYDDLMAKRN